MRLRATVESRATAWRGRRMDQDQPTKQKRQRHGELRVVVNHELRAAVEKHLEAMRQRDPLRGYVLADAVRELVIRGLHELG